MMPIRRRNCSWTVGASVRRMKTWLLAGAVVLVVGSLRMTAQPQAAAQSQAVQPPATDVTFRGLIEAKNIGEYMRLMAARPHHLGSPYGKQNADWILAKFKEWGWDARIESYDVLFPTPKERVLELLGPTRVQGVARGAGTSRSTRPPHRSPSSCPRSTPTPSTATSPVLSSTSTTGVPSDYEELDAARHLGQGRDRHRALWPVVARHQAEGGGRARRHRLPDLLRSPRRRVLRRRRVSRWTDAQSGRRAARQRHGHADRTPAIR